MLKPIRILFYGSLVALPITLITSLAYVRVYTFDVLFVPLVVAILIQFVTQPNVLRINLQGIDKAVLVTLVAVSISCLFSDRIGNSVTNWVDWIRYSAVYFISRALFENKIVSSGQLFRVFSIIGVALVVIGIIQMITQSKIGLISAYFGGGQFDSAAIVSEQYSRGTYHRVSGTHPNPNIFAMWVTLFFGSLLVRLLLSRKYWWFLVMGALGSVSIIGSLARGGVAAFFLFLVILMLANAKRLFDAKFILILTLTIVMIASFLAAGFVVEGLNVKGKIDAFDTRVEQAVSEGQAEGRFLQVVSGFEEMKRVKVLAFGTGWGNYQNEFRNVIHNMWMQILTELGSFVFIAVLVLTVSFINAARKLRINKDISSNARFLWAYLSASLIPYFLISSQVYHTAGEHELIIPVMILMALTVSMRVIVPGGSFENKEAILQNNRILSPAKKKSV